MMWRQQLPSGDIYLDRVIDDQIGRHDRVNLVRISTKARKSGTHGSKVDNRWYTAVHNGR